MQTRLYKNIIVVFLLLIVVSFSACANQTGDQSIQQIDQSKLVIIDDTYQYIDWDAPKLISALNDWQANPSLYEPVGIMLSDRGEAEGLSLEQTINKLHDDYEKLGVDSCYMAVMIEALSSEMNMFNQKTFELNLPINPNTDKVALNAVNIKPKDGYDYTDLTDMIEKYNDGKIDPQTMVDFVNSVDMKLVIDDSAYDKLYACDVSIREVGKSDGDKVVKLFINSGVDGAYFEILR